MRDVADGVIAAAEKGRKGECYILSNRFVPIPDLMKYMQKATGGPKKIFPLLLRQLLHRREVGRDADGARLGRWSLSHPRTGSVLKTNPPCRVCREGFSFVCQNFEVSLCRQIEI